MATLKDRVQKHMQTVAAAPVKKAAAQGKGQYREAVKVLDAIIILGKRWKKDPLMNEMQGPGFYVNEAYSAGIDALVKMLRSKISDSSEGKRMFNTLIREVRNGESAFMAPAIAMRDYFKPSK